MKKKTRSSLASRFSSSHRARRSPRPRAAPPLSALSLPSLADVPAMLDPNLQVTTGPRTPASASRSASSSSAGQRLPGAREGVGPDQAGDRRRHPADARARPGGELELRARAAEHGAAPELPANALRLHSLDRELHRGRLDRAWPTCRCSATASIATSGTASTLHARQQHHHDCAPARPTTSPCPDIPGTNNGDENGNHNGGVDPLRARRQALCLHGRPGPPRAGCRTSRTARSSPPRSVDDTFGGPAPDNAHLSGVILRLNDDGSTPADNPFFAAGAAIGGEVGANIQKIYSYGHRNGFGMAFDPLSGRSLGDRERRRRLQRTQPRRSPE